MKLLFVINDWRGANIICQHTNHMPMIHRRAVEIELTPEQMVQINLQKIGFDNGDVFEEIESISPTKG